MFIQNSIFFTFYRFYGRKLISPAEHRFNYKNKNIVTKQKGWLFQLCALCAFKSECKDKSITSFVTNVAYFIYQG